MTTSFRVSFWSWRDGASDGILAQRPACAVYGKIPAHNYLTYPGESAPHADIVLFCLPVNPHREVVRQIAPLLKKNCLCISIARAWMKPVKPQRKFLRKILAHQLRAAVWSMISEEIRQAGMPLVIRLLRSCGIPYYVLFYHTNCISITLSTSRASAGP